MTVYRWTITIEAHSDLVADGFDVSNQVTGSSAGGELSMLGRIVDHYPADFCRVRVIEAPARELILAEQLGELDHEQEADEVAGDSFDGDLLANVLEFGRRLAFARGERGEK